jgi:ArsR family transcriptional regulator
MAPVSAARTATRGNDVRSLERKATQVAGLLGALANERRLMILCRLVEWGEGNVGALAAAVGLSQSALSQHLARMRQEGLVAFRRDGQTLWYRIADPRVEELFATLRRLFCQETPESTPKSTLKSTTESARRRK